MSNQVTLKIECDAQPLFLFTEIFQSFLQRSERLFDFSDFGFELARVDCDFSTATTGKVFVRLYPSDAFLSFAGAIFARDFDFSTIEKVSHN
ncbi:MAG: hypothetical protein Q7U33_10065 [Methylotenera sp.]|uniref:hypothetical protein n=1 Tax=Methylotenera sp. TaxID=2051956 RepID=UPI00271F9480|nr:hypothetical protein [Methylotenera sp.]MDO9151710.1 hypothetical protein [Methylotenera sp.]